MNIQRLLKLLWIQILPVPCSLHVGLLFSASLSCSLHWWCVIGCSSPPWSAEVLFHSAVVWQPCSYTTIAFDYLHPFASMDPQPPHGKTLSHIWVSFCLDQVISNINKVCNTQTPRIERCNLWSDSSSKSYKTTITCVQQGSRSRVFFIGIL